VLLVRLHPDLLAGLQGHQHELRVAAREEHAAVILVSEGRLFDIGDITDH
jgi:hypothetical protein